MLNCFRNAWELLNVNYYDFLVLLNSILQILRGFSNFTILAIHDVLNLARCDVKLTDILTNLSVQSQAVSNNKHCVKHRFVISIVLEQIAQTECQPCNGITLS